MNDLLQVLDMSEDEQKEWVCENGCPNCEEHGSCPSLADLAFRLRDEFLAKGNHHNWEFALVEVWEQEQRLRGVTVDVNQWANKYAKPIHWIIAALIAKEKGNA